MKLIGSVIDYTYRDHTPVLLVMERLARDLHTALKNKLLFQIRSVAPTISSVTSVCCSIQVALDVVEGLRYLHGLGLVHRDIKLKNVLVSDL